jgi:hypothetical protein
MRRQALVTIDDDLSLRVLHHAEGCGGGSVMGRSSRNFFYWLGVMVVALAAAHQAGLVRFTVPGDSRVKLATPSAQAAYDLCSGDAVTNAENVTTAHVPTYNATSPDLSVWDLGASAFTVRSYTVRSTVDYQSSAGAVVRHHYVCNVSYPLDSGVRVWLALKD